MDAFEQAMLTVRFLSADGVEKAGCGHPGTPMALAGIGVELFTQHLRYNPADPTWPNRDRFVLSCGHASMLLYSLVHLAGYPLTKDDLMQFRQWQSKTPGHPEVHRELGIETSTGPLGQGISNAVGMALASKLYAARFNTADSLFDYRVFVLASDGDLMEGVTHEAMSLAGHWGLGNLIVVYDANGITIDGKAELCFSDDVGKRAEAVGWHVQHVDGHDRLQVTRALTAASAAHDRPSLIVAKTHIAIGAPTKQDTSKAHGSALGAAEVGGAKRAAGWPEEPEFYVPETVYALFGAQVERTRPHYERWQRQLTALDPERRRLWERFTSERIPRDLFSQLLAGLESDGSLDRADATRSMGGKVLQKAAALAPALLGGSADLDASTQTHLKGAGTIAKGSFAGRNLHYGIREHAMGAISNGLALSGFIPFNATFLIFSDYMRPTLRLAAMMRQQVISVYTHDSIYVGEDGPTHQPIEQLASLRVIPNLHVFRPADAFEVAAAWTHALERTDGPTVLALSRQKVAHLEHPSDFNPRCILEGAYILQDTADPDVVLIATGSEVALAVETKPLLERAGHRVRIVSIPCLELFQRLPRARQQALLPASARRVAIEAAHPGVWPGIVGLEGICVCIERYGASAPYERLQIEFGFTPEAVAARVLGSFA